MDASIEAEPRILLRGRVDFLPGDPIENIVLILVSPTYVLLRSGAPETALNRLRELHCHYLGDLIQLNTTYFKRAGIGPVEAGLVLHALSSAHGLSINMQLDPKLKERYEEERGAVYPSWGCRCGSPDPL